MDYLNLSNILEAFNAAINEEQAWAVCYQCCKFLQAQWKKDPTSCELLDGLRSLELNKDGLVARIISSRGPATSQNAVVQSLGVVLFQALDYGLTEEEEHQLSPPLEALIDRMTGAGGGAKGRRGEEEEAEEEEGSGEADDEGIEELEDEEDEEEAGVKLSLDDVLTVCKMHLANSSQEASHYKAVVRALVTEAIELITFLEKIAAHNQRLRSQPSEDGEEDVTDLQRSDWARLWMQIMRNLRKGVKLKKVDSSAPHSHSPSEFELTPYEVLMEDIRTRRYELKKVMVNGDIPTTVKKDAHEVILDFIRSRPPLHPMKERQLPDAPRRIPDIREQLMNDIKQTHTLRPTPGNAGRSASEMSNGSASNGHTKEETPKSTRKVIKPNICLFDSDEDEEDMSEDEPEEEEPEEDEEDKNKVTPSPLSPLTPLSPEASNSRTLKIAKLRTGDAPDSALAIAAAASASNGERRHSITLMQSPTNPEAPSSPDLGITGGNIMGPHGPAGPLSGFMKSFSATDSSSEIPRSLQSSLECLSLTVEEVMHIRSVLTKAELECLLTRPDLHELVSKGKVCFTCKKTKFSLFGTWATKCKFCRRNVCSQCVSKMRIPTEHFEHIPVYTLSPSPVSPQSQHNLFVFESSDAEAPEVPPPRKFSLPAFLPSFTLPNFFSSKSAAPESPNVIYSKNAAPDSPDLHIFPSNSAAPSSPDIIHSNRATPPNSPDLQLTSSNGSAPNSPDGPRKSFMPSFSVNTSYFTSSTSSSSSTASSSSSRNRRGSAEHPRGTRAPLQRSQTTVRPPPLKRTASVQGPLMDVCKDCKAMIVNIIRASRISLALAPRMSPMQPPQTHDASTATAKAPRNFHLNLKPVHPFGNKKK